MASNLHREQREQPLSVHSDASDADRFTAVMCQARCSQWKPAFWLATVKKKRKEKKKKEAE